MKDNEQRFRCSPALQMAHKSYSRCKLLFQARPLIRFLKGGVRASREPTGS